MASTRRPNSHCLAALPLPLGVSGSERQQGPPVRAQPIMQSTVVCRAQAGARPTARAGSVPKPAAKILPKVGGLAAGLLSGAGVARADELALPDLPSLPEVNLPDAAAVADAASDIGSLFADNPLVRPPAAIPLAGTAQPAACVVWPPSRTGHPCQPYIPGSRSWPRLPPRLALVATPDGARCSPAAAGGRRPRVAAGARGHQRHPQPGRQWPEDQHHHSRAGAGGAGREPQGGVCGTRHSQNFWAASRPSSYSARHAMLVQLHYLPPEPHHILKKAPPCPPCR